MEVINYELEEVATKYLEIKEVAEEVKDRILNALKKYL